MAPQGHVSPGFDWRNDLRDARTKIESASPEAAAALAKALGSAFQMADICQRTIGRGPTWQVNSAPPSDWVDFLETLTHEATFFYPYHLSMPNDLRASLITKFAKIADNAIEAQTQITHMPKPSQKTSKKAMTDLQNLMKTIMATVQILAPPAEATISDLPGPSARERAEISAPPEATLVPLVGRIAAGSPNLADQEVEDIFPLPRQVVGIGNLFLLRVYSHSMTGAGIAEGDWVVIRKQQDAQNGEIVIAMTDEGATIKKYEISGEKVTLRAQNPVYDDVPGNRATIMGKVVAVFRKL